MRVEGLTELEQEFARRAPQRMALLSAQTLNRALTRGRTRLVRIVTGQINLPAGYVREQITLLRATPDRLEATMSARKRPVQLARFDARAITRRAGGKRIRAGVSVRVKRGGGRETLPGAFLIRLRMSNATGVALRAKVAGRRARRTPIEVLYGPSLDQLYRQVRPELRDELQAYVRDELRRRVAQTVLGR